MFSRVKVYLKNFDWIMFSAVLLLVIFGLVEIYSVALGQGSANLLNFQKQLLFAGLGFLCLFLFAFLDSNWLRSLNGFLYGLAVAVLLAVLAVGSTIRGHKGWLYLGSFNLQPVEFVKVALILSLAAFFAGLATKVKTLRHFLLSLLGAGLFIGLVLLQQDLGSAVILAAIWLLMIIIAGFNRKYYLAVGLGLLVVLTVGWFLFFKGYQKDRIINFFNPGADAQASGYNISQAIIAVGAGGLTGKGVGFGSQSQLKFLPEAQTDFIFAVIAEELGFGGVLLILLFYGVLFFRCWRILPQIKNDFGIYFIIGGAGLIFIQMFINIGMNLGIMPVVGLPLPFVSYGGSSLVSLLILVGIMENIIIKSKISF